MFGILHALTSISSAGNASLDVVAGPIGEALAATGVIFLDRTPVQLAALEGELNKIHAGSEEVSVQLNADEGVDYGIVAKAISSIDRGGVKRLSVMTAGE